YRDIKPVGNGFRARLGFTANYAAAVHAMPGKLKGQPRDSNDPSRGDFWDPDAEPEFLTKAFERDGRADINATFKRYMKLRASTPLPNGSRAYRGPAIECWPVGR